MVQRTKPRADLHQQLVAHPVSIDVVDRFEAIEVDDTDEERRPRIAIFGYRGFHSFEEDAPVRHTGQRVGHRDRAILGRQSGSFLLLQRQLGLRRDEFDETLEHVLRDTDHQRRHDRRVEGDQHEGRIALRQVEQHIGHHDKQVHQPCGLRQVDQAEDAADRRQYDADRDRRLFERSAELIQKERIAEIGDGDRYHRKRRAFQRYACVLDRNGVRRRLYAQPVDHPCRADHDEHTAGDGQNRVGGMVAIKQNDGGCGNDEHGV